MPKKIVKQHNISKPSFHTRFEIQVGIDEAFKRFVNRVRNQIFEVLFPSIFKDNIDIQQRLKWALANKLGEHYSWYTSYENFVKSDFFRCLQVLEISYTVLPTKKAKYQLARQIKSILNQSEIDLGVTWQNEAFVRSGATLLDNVLINEPLRWLSNPLYSTVYNPFLKGLTHLLGSTKKPELRSDVITDMYESLESLAKVITGRQGVDLSGNTELFLKNIKASDSYKQIFKAYIGYANLFRHGIGNKNIRPTVSDHEIESFVYLTGLFIRLAISKQS